MSWLVGAKKSSIRTVEEANEIIKAVNVDNLGFVFDTANLYMCGKLTNFDSMRIVDKEKIYEVHINDLMMLKKKISVLRRDVFVEKVS